MGLLALALLVAAGTMPPPAAALPVAPEAPPTPGDAASVGPFTFELGPYELHKLPIERLYYNGASIVGCGLTDGQGVAIYRASDGVIYNHPGAQARCALNMQRNYRVDPRPEYLEQAAANAQRLVSLAVSHGGGIFFPHPFRWNNPHRNTMIPPWYSAMTQGQALSAFVRLYEWTGEARWRTAADQTFRSFLVARQPGKPWVVGIDRGRLWLDEYASTPLDRVYNGHNFALYGLYDYWRLTDNAQARLLALGAIHSSYVAATTEVRDPGGISFYCLSAPCVEHRVKNAAYHPTHAGQLMRMYHITHHWHFASLMEAFQADSPWKSSGQARLAPGAHDAYAFDRAGIGTKVATVNLPGFTVYNYSRREVPGAVPRPGNGVWLMISEGPLTGRWVRESDRAYALGLVDDELTQLPPRPIQAESGSYNGRTHASNGAVTDFVTAQTEAATWTYTRYAKINGRPSVLMSSGPLEGYWVILDPRLTRDTTLFTDIDASGFRPDIIWLNDHGITMGCAAYAFCPSGPVTREQMASFLARALDLPAVSRDFFTDDETSGHEADINRLSAAGITIGCGGTRFCPRGPVAREQMASFLVRALELPAVGDEYFADDDSSIHEADINALAASGVTLGCAVERFCPRATVKREQMAAFLRRALSPAARLEPPSPRTAHARPLASAVAPLAGDAVLPPAWAGASALDPSARRRGADWPPPRVPRAAA